MAFTRTAGPATGAQVHGDGTLEIRKVATLEKAGEGDITFLSNKSTGIIWSRARRPPCSSQKRICHFVPPMPWCSKTLCGLCPGSPTAGHHPQPATDIHPSAVIAADVQLGESGHRGQCGDRIRRSAGDDVRIGPGCFVGKNTRLGARSRLWANVTLYHNITMGTDCLVQSGTVIGADGFGYANERGEWIKIPSSAA